MFTNRFAKLSILELRRKFTQALGACALAALYYLFLDDHGIPAVGAVLLTLGALYLVAQLYWLQAQSQCAKCLYLRPSENQACPCCADSRLRAKQEEQHLRSRRYAQYAYVPIIIGLALGAHALGF